MRAGSALSALGPGDNHFIGPPWLVVTEMSNEFELPFPSA